MPGVEAIRRLGANIVRKHRFLQQRCHANVGSRPRDVTDNTKQAEIETNWFERKIYINRVA